MTQSAQINMEVGIAFVYCTRISTYIVLRTRRWCTVRAQDMSLPMPSRDREKKSTWRTRSMALPQCFTWYLSIVSSKSCASIVFRDRTSTAAAAAMEAMAGTSNSNTRTHIHTYKTQTASSKYFVCMCYCRFGWESSLKWTHTKLFRLLLNIVRIFMSIKNG